MTSSLVGSEMCIRDRCISVLEQWRGCGALESVESMQALSCEQYAVLEPVSYTHLTLPTICSV
eukprot:11734553-Prorocentrum_lima.AAC.1